MSKPHEQQIRETIEQVLHENTSANTLLEENRADYVALTTAVLQTAATANVVLLEIITTAKDPNVRMIACSVAMNCGINLGKR